MAKHAIKISILLVWVALMGWWWLESCSWPAPEKIEAAFLPNYNDYYSLAYNGQKIGWSFRSLTRQADGGYQAANGVVVRALTPGGNIDIQSNIQANLDKTLNLIDFAWAVRAGEVTLAESGAVADGRLAMDISLGRHQPMLEELLTEYKDLLGPYAGQLDFSRTVVLPMPDGPGLSHVMPSYLSYLGLKAGRNYSLTVVEPAGRSLAPLAVRVVGEGEEFDIDMARKTQAFEVRFGDEITGATMWLDRFGRVFREEALGFSLVRVDGPGRARDGIVGFSPPPVFADLLKNEKMKILLENVKQPAD
ncbi:hypothetical protein LJB99_02740 [Deltaproteobacteria bacterium OttesenSCG-928-K17]|nr:hypothetical protein [Deltaproteobacteria bacterium OttesenSCG-928-K17]